MDTWPGAGISTEDEAVDLRAVVIKGVDHGDCEYRSEEV